jgi:ribosomal protein L37AE/L43A
MYYCPCCTDSLLKHIRGQETYWFCRSCWQEMPILSQSHSSVIPQPILEKLSKKIARPQTSLRDIYVSKRRSLASNTVLHSVSV